MSNLANVFLSAMAVQVAAKAKAEGIDVMNTVNANSDAAKQVTDIQNLLAAGAQGLIVQPLDASAIIPGLNAAAAKGVPVVVLDSAPEGGKVAMVVQADQTNMAEAACDQLGKVLNGKGTVLEIQGDLGSLNGQLRSSGFENCLKAKYPAIKVIARQAKAWDAVAAANAVATVLGANPDLAGMYLASDCAFGAAALTSLKNAGKTALAGEPGHVAVVAIDGCSSGLDAIRAGTIDAIISQPEDLYAKYGLQYLTAAVGGATFAAGPTDHNTTIVEYKGNLVDYMPGTLVTKANVDDPTLWGNVKA